MKEFNFWEDIEEALNNQFPKGKCKERGQALVLFAHFHLQFKEYVKRIIEVAQSDWTKKERIEWIKKLAGANYYE